MFRLNEAARERGSKETKTLKGLYIIAQGCKAAMGLDDNKSCDPEGVTLM